MLIDIRSISRSLDATLAVETEIGPDEPFCKFQEYRLTSPLVFRGVLQNSGDSAITLTGRIRTTYRGECARCLTEVESELDQPVKERFRAQGQAGSGEDEDSYRYGGTMLDISQAIRDNLVTALPQRLLCREGCRGLCPVCGANLNEQDCGHDMRQG
jgi:uncharacterized protein